MNRAFALCLSLVVLASIGFWSVHSVGQDLLDSSADADYGEEIASEDDIFDRDQWGVDGLYGGDAGSDNGSEDLFSDGDSADDAGFEDGLLDDPDAGGFADIESGEEADDETILLDDSDPGMDAGLDAAPPSGGGSLSSLQRSTHRLEQFQQMLLQRYIQTKDKTARDKLAEQLIDAVRKEFDVRQKQRTAELKKLESEIKRLWSIHQRRDREKNSIVRNRVRQLIRDKEGLGWGSNSVSRSFR